MKETKEGYLKITLTIPFILLLIVLPLVVFGFKDIGVEVVLLCLFIFEVLMLSNYFRDKLWKSEKLLIKVRCPKCGRLNDETAIFCCHCGAKLKQKI